MAEALRQTCLYVLVDEAMVRALHGVGRKREEEIIDLSGGCDQRVEGILVCLKVAAGVADDDAGRWSPVPFRHFWMVMVSLSSQALIPVPRCFLTTRRNAI